MVSILDEAHRLPSEFRKCFLASLIPARTDVWGVGNSCVSDVRLILPQQKVRKIHSLRRFKEDPGCDPDASFKDFTLLQRLNMIDRVARVRRPF